MRDATRPVERRSDPARIDVPEGEVRVLESHHAPDFRMEACAWPFHKIARVAVGRGLLEISGKSVPIRESDCLLLPAGRNHRFVDDPRRPLALVILCVSEGHLAASPGRRLKRLWNAALGQVPPGAPVRARTAFHRTLLEDAFRRALREQGNRAVGWETALAGVADQLLVNLARGYCEPRTGRAPSGREAIGGALEYIDDHLHEPLRIPDMAERCHLSPRRFTDLFKQRTGTTFSRYLNEKRVAFACRRLEETGHILYACHESGFDDLSYFYRVFKKITGKTPGEYAGERNR